MPECSLYCLLFCCPEGALYRSCISIYVCSILQSYNTWHLTSSRASPGLTPFHLMEPKKNPTLS